MVDFYNVPYDHSGRWDKNEKSIFNPGTFVTWPQFLAECVIWWRSKLIKDFPKITYGKGWSNAISGQYKRLIQQMYQLCNYFPHPEDDKLVRVSFKNYIRKNRVTQVGSYRKNRITKDGKLNISDAEKDFVKGVEHEFNQLKKQRESLYNEMNNIPQKTKDQIKFRTKKTSKNNINKLMDMESDG